jgi:hypothetical protein
MFSKGQPVRITQFVQAPSQNKESLLGRVGEVTGRFPIAPHLVGRFGTHAYELRFNDPKFRHLTGSLVYGSELEAVGIGSSTKSTRG